VLVHIVMVGLLSQVMDKVRVVNMVKDNVGVVAVLAMHSVNVDKITEGDGQDNCERGEREHGEEH
jgi:hypothetical protein